MGSEPRPRQLTRVLVAALCAAVTFAPTAWGADATQCTEDSPLGAWIRFQTDYHVQPRLPGATGCDVTFQQYLRLDMLQTGPKFTRTTIEATIPPSLTGSARDNLVQQMLNQFGKKALIERYHVTRIRFQIRRNECVKTPGGTDTITGLKPLWISGTVVLGEDSPVGFREVRNPVGSLSFDPFGPEIDSHGTLWEDDLVKRAVVPSYRGGFHCEPCTTAEVDAYKAVHAADDMAQGQDSGPMGDYRSATFETLEPAFPPLPQVLPTTASHGTSTPYGIESSGCPSVRCFLVEPTKCFKRDEAQFRECLANPSKYSVIPFEGKSDWRGETPLAPGVAPMAIGAGWYRSSKIAWKICCGCAQIGGIHH